jgi:hypothetical protein
LKIAGTVQRTVSRRGSGQSSTDPDQKFGYDVGIPLPVTRRMSFAAVMFVRLMLCWAVGFGTLCILSLWLEPKRARRKEILDLCRWCRYDLRATPDRCPECGRVPDRQQAPR